MSQDSEAPKRVLLTSHPEPIVHPLAPLMHDARNKLHPILIALQEREDSLDKTHFAALTMTLEDVRTQTQNLLDAARAERVDSAHVLEDLSRMRSRMEIVAGIILNIQKEKPLVSSHQIAQAAEDFDAIIARGLQYAQGEPANDVPDRRNISQFIGVIVQDYESRFPNIDFVFETDSDHDVTFCPISIRRTMENLLNNAIQALPNANGRIVIRLNERSYGSEDKPFDEIEDGIYIGIEISDNGSGIPEEVLEQLRDSTVTTKKGGSGLGLVSARRSMIQHQGHLFLESEEGHGARVTALLPNKLPLPARVPKIS